MTTKTSIKNYKKVNKNIPTNTTKVNVNKNNYYEWKQDLEKEKPLTIAYNNYLFCHIKGKAKPRSELVKVQSVLRED